MTPARDPKQIFFEKNLEAIWESLRLSSNLAGLCIWEASGDHQESIWEASSIWVASGHPGYGKHLGSIWEASGTHLGSIWETAVGI